MELRGDSEIARSHFMIRFDPKLNGFVVKDVGVGIGQSGGTFVKVGKKIVI